MSNRESCYVYSLTFCFFLGMCVRKCDISYLFCKLYQLNCAFRNYLSTLVERCNSNDCKRMCMVDPVRLDTMHGGVLQ